MNFEEWKQKVDEAVKLDINALKDNIVAMKGGGVSSERVKAYLFTEVAQRSMQIDFCTPDNIVGVSKEDSGEAAIYLSEAYQKVIDFLNSELENMERLT